MRTITMRTYEVTVFFEKDGNIFYNQTAKFDDEKTAENFMVKQSKEIAETSDFHYFSLMYEVGYDKEYPYKKRVVCLRYADR